MQSKLIKAKKTNNETSEKLKNLLNCEVCIASNEIMLNRLYNGEECQFPFSK